MARVRYRELAAEIREQIMSGQYPPGATLPAVNDLAAMHDVSRTTITAALQLLQAENLVRGVTGRGTVVLDTRAIRVEFSRYAAVLQPGSQLGPWETACQRAGVPGEMVLMEVSNGPVGSDVASALGITPGDPVVYRARHATMGDPPQTVQIHQGWYPRAIVAGTPLAGQAKVRGGVLAALVAAGIAPVTADEQVGARMATQDELSDLNLRGGAVLVVERVTRGTDGTALEFLRVVADTTHTRLVYDALPLSRS